MTLQAGDPETIRSIEYALGLEARQAATTDFMHRATNPNNNARLELTGFFLDIREYSREIGAVGTRKLIQTVPLKSPILLTARATEFTGTTSTHHNTKLEEIIITDLSLEGLRELRLPNLPHRHHEFVDFADNPDELAKMAEHRTMSLTLKRPTATMVGSLLLYERFVNPSEPPVLTGMRIL